MGRKHAPNPHVANPQEAFREVAYAHGVPRLAADMGLMPGTLYNKADAKPDSKSQPTLRDVVLSAKLTGDLRVIDALNRLFNRGTFDLAPGPVSDEAVLELLCRVGSENGEMQKALHKALADGRFTHEDLGAVRGEAHQLITAVLDLVQRLEGLVDE